MSVLNGVPAATKKWRGLAAYSATRNLGQNLVQVFVPLLLLGQGVSLPVVLALNALNAGVVMFLVYPAVRTMERWDVRIGYLVSAFFMVDYLVLLAIYLGTGESWLLWVMPLAFGLSVLTYWLSYDLMVAHRLEPESAGKDLASLETVGKAATQVAPAVGAQIVNFFGGFWLSYISTILVAVSPAFLKGNGHQQAGTMPDKPLSRRRKAPWRHRLANVGFNVHNAGGGALWAIYLAVVASSVNRIGWMLSAAGVAGYVVYQVTGHYTDKRQWGFPILAMSAVLLAYANIFKMLPPTTVWLTVASIAYTTTAAIQRIPWVSTYYKAVREGGHNYVASMHTVSYATSFVLWSALAALAYFVHDAATVFRVAFVFTAFAGLLCALLRDREGSG